MSTQALRFITLAEHDRKRIRAVSMVSAGDTVELRVHHAKGGQETATLPAEAAALIGIVLDLLSQGERVAILAEDQEVSPNEAAMILGISRPLVVHRMEVGDLPFRYVGKHRRAQLKDVLVLKKKVDEQRAALEALANETEALMRDHAL